MDSLQCGLIQQMLRRSCALLLCTLFALTPTQASAKHLTLSTLEGLSITELCGQVVSEAYSKIDVNVRINLYPAKRSLSVSNGGDVDGELMRIANAEKKYPNLIRIPTSICSMSSRVYSKNPNLNLEDWSSLKPYRIGIHRGHLYALNGTQGMQAIQINSNESMFKMLDADRVDVIVAHVPDATRTIGQMRLKNVYPVSPIISDVKLYHYLHKKHQDLVPQIDTALQEMEQNGRIAQLAEEFLKSVEQLAVRRPSH